MIDDITLIMASFARPDSLRRTLDSVRTRYPQLPIIIGNVDRPGTLVVDDPGTRVIDVGDYANSSAGRNAAMSLVQTPYVLLSDDDHEFDDDTDLYLWRQLLERHPQYDLIGGKLYVAGDRNREQHWEGVWTQENQRLVFHAVATDEDVIPADVVLQFFLGRTAVLQAHAWDEDIPIGGEHIDYFYCAKNAGIRVAYTPLVSANHMGCRPTALYRKMRNRNYVQAFQAKHGLVITPQRRQVPRLRHLRGKDLRDSIRQSARRRRWSVDDVQEKRV